MPRNRFTPALVPSTIRVDRDSSLPFTLASMDRWTEKNNVIGRYFIANVP